VSSVSKGSDSTVFCAPQVVISPGSLVIDTGGGGGGGGATPQIVISPARADSEKTKSNDTVAHSLHRFFIVFSRGMRMVCKEQRKVVPNKTSVVRS